MLLRQLYLCHFEQKSFKRALEVSEQAIELGVLSDVLHQDAARAAAAQEDLALAARHLRLAARVGPPSRRAFHWWTLGSLYFLANRSADAIGAFERAARWGTRDKPLYHGHLAAARCAAGEQVDDLDECIERLAAVPAGQGYGRFVLGLLAFYDHRYDDAREYFETFVARMTRGRPTTSIALGGEIAHARRMMASMPHARR